MVKDARIEGNADKLTIVKLLDEAGYEVVDIFETTRITKHNGTAGHLDERAQQLIQLSLRPRKNRSGSYAAE